MDTYIAKKGAQKELNINVAIILKKAKNTFVSLSEDSHLDLIPDSPCNVLDTCIHAP